MMILPCTNQINRLKLIGYIEVKHNDVKKIEKEIHSMFNDKMITILDVLGKKHKSEWFIEKLDQIYLVIGRYGDIKTNFNIE